MLEFCLPARPEYVAVARDLVASVAVRRLGWNGETVDDLRLAVSEACTNAVEVHRRNGVARGVLVRLRERGERLEIEVVDAGPGFDPDALPRHPPVTDPERLNYERGLGIPLIRALADEVAFESKDDGTHVTMVMGPTPVGPRSVGPKTPSMS